MPGFATPPLPDWDVDLEPSWAEAFDAQVDRSGDGCHVWIGYVDPDGYGRFTFRSRQSQAHRTAYELAHGYVPSGLVVDHLCAVKSCVNPAHLEAVTNGENVRRGGRPHFREAVA